jgi:hypothetical protein
MREPRPALIELTISRVKEFVRETEALFWVFGFPLLLTLALGFAFREKPPDRIPIGVAAGPKAQERLDALSRSPALQPRVYACRRPRGTAAWQDLIARRRRWRAGLPLRPDAPRVANGAR